MQNAIQLDINQEADKVSNIQISYASSQPYAMMVHPQDAFSTFRTMMTEFRFTACAFLAFFTRPTGHFAQFLPIVDRITGTVPHRQPEARQHPNQSGDERGKKQRNAIVAFPKQMYIKATDKELKKYHRSSTNEFSRFIHSRRHLFITKNKNNNQIGSACGQIKWFLKPKARQVQSLMHLRCILPPFWETQGQPLAIFVDSSCSCNRQFLHFEIPTKTCRKRGNGYQSDDPAEPMQLIKYQVIKHPTKGMQVGCTSARKLQAAQRLTDYLNTLINITSQSTGLQCNSDASSPAICTNSPPMHHHHHKGNQNHAHKCKGSRSEMLADIVKCYVNNIISETTGLKVILFDEETAGMVSTVYTMSNLLQKEVFLVEKLDNEEREELSIFKCICILRPTTLSIDRLCCELKRPKYTDYYIYFTNVLRRGFLDKIAQADAGERVRAVKEYYMDFYAPISNYFTLNQELCIGNSFNTWKKEALQRTAEGLLSCLFATSCYPVIRFDKSSPMAYRLAEEISTQFREISSSLSSTQKEPMTVLVLDRRSDLTTPLLSHWTYLSMIHELLEFKNGLVSFTSLDENQVECKREYSLMADEDEFYKLNAFSEFGVLGDNIKQFVECYREQTTQSQNLRDIQNMKKFINEYANYKKMGLTVSRHVSIIDEITKRVAERKLLQCSEVEQALASPEQKLQSDFCNVTKILDIVDVQLQLKILLMFYLKYRNHCNFPTYSHEITSRILELIPKQVFESFLAYAEYEKIDSVANSGSLKENILQRGKATINSFKGNNMAQSATTADANSLRQQANGQSSVYTQHKPIFGKILKGLQEGRLSESQFPYFDMEQARMSPRTNSCMIFFINGATLDEVKIASSFPNVICGSTSTCSFQTLLAEIKQLATNKN